MKTERRYPMQVHFVTSDEHYGHQNIIRYCNRPFSSTDEMTETLIARFNKVVPNNRNYLTLHAGDLFWHTLTEDEITSIINRLHGRHAFLWGNHDEKLEGSPFLQSFFEWHSHSHIQNVRGHRLTINHYAQRNSDKSHQGSWHVYGHSHGELPGLGKSFDIGVDSHDFKPWSVDEIADKMETLPGHHKIAPEDIWPGKTPTTLERPCLDSSPDATGYSESDLDSYPSPNPAEDLASMLTLVKLGLGGK